jgi:hypothetical protein
MSWEKMQGAVELSISAIYHALKNWQLPYDIAILMVYRRPMPLA